jgi:DNA repair protein REV1
LQELPGVGYVTRHKLAEIGCQTCSDALNMDKSTLRNLLGPSVAENLLNSATGLDNRSFEVTHRSIGAEISWGIRFSNDSEVKTFIASLAEEVGHRLRECEMRGETITLKIKTKRLGAPSPRKFMGHGICDNFSKSRRLPEVTDSTAIISSTSWELYKALSTKASELRGIGIQLSRLEPASAKKVIPFTSIPHTHTCIFSCAMILFT